MFRRLALVLLVGCTSAPDEVDFASFAGSASDFDECHCQYEDGSAGSPSLQIDCFGSGEVETMAMFIDPRITGDQSAVLFLQAVSAEYAGGGTGTFGTLGEAHRDGVAINRSIDGLDFTWVEQDTCSVDHGCIDAELTTYHLAAGAAHVGSGKCEDLELEIQDDLP